MEITSPFIRGRRISRLLKLQSSVLGTEITVRSQAPRKTVRPPDKWEVIDGSWAAMTKRTRGGCAPCAVDLPRLLVLPPGRHRAGSPVGLPSNLAGATSSTVTLLKKPSERLVPSIEEIPSGKAW